MVFRPKMVVPTVRRHAASMPDNSTIPPPNSTAWVIPTDAGRSLQADIVACAATTYLIASAFVLLRFYTRGWLNRVLGPSDWCILPALLCAAGVTASGIEQMVHGAGKHAWEADPFALPAFERAAWYGILFYNLSLTLTRISILLLYQRIFTYTWIKRAIWAVLILVIVIGIWLVVSVVTACIPLQAFWDWSLFFTTDVYCQPPNLWWGNAALHIVSDLVIMALPMPVLSSLKLPRRQKYAIVGVFALGFFVCVISVVRLTALIELTQAHSFDATYTSANMIYWTTVEVNSAISCACIMTLKPLIQRVFPRLLSPSAGPRDPTLQWITPIHTADGAHHNVTVCSNRRSLPPTTPTSPNHNHPSPNRPSDASNRTTSKHSASSTTAIYEASQLQLHLQPPRRPSVAHSHPNSPSYSDQLEKSRYYHGVIADARAAAACDLDLDRDLDLEAQRTCCYTTTASDASSSSSSSSFACAARFPVGTAASADAGTSLGADYDTPAGADSSGREAAGRGSLYARHQVAGGADGGAGGGGGDDEAALEVPAALLRAPPRAHLSLSIQPSGHVTPSGFSGGEGEEVELRERRQV